MAKTVWYEYLFATGVAIQTRGMSKTELACAERDYGKLITKRRI